ncbi:hypothetical protein [Massilia sp. 9096]|uniref:hypothetical protein n=1 Tax=Massilia sp. 9096 TaxID=1500894 RepID=UPI00055DA5AC|nr:hypothetical protein [Massilia sp. 9096]
MERFLIVYRGAPGATPEASHDPQRWTGWFDALGANALDRGALDAAAVEIPSRLLGPKESTSSLSGYCVIAAEDFNAAVRLADACPIYDMGGSLEIARLGPPPG